MFGLSWWRRQERRHYAAGKSTRMTDSIELAEQSDPVPEPSSELEIAGEGWSAADIEEAYLEALHAMQDLPSDGKAPVESSESPRPEPVAADGPRVPDAVLPTGLPSSADV